MAIKPFVYVAAAGVTVGLLIVAGNVLGRAVDPGNAPVAANPPTEWPTQRLPDAPIAVPQPEPTPAPAPAFMPSFPATSGTPSASPWGSSPSATPVPSFEALPAPGQPAPGQPMPGQPVPGLPAPGQPGPDQTVPGQPVPGQTVPGQPGPDQLVPGQPMPGQPVPGQPAPALTPSGQPTSGYDQGDTGRPIQVAGVQPGRIAPGDGPFGSIVGTGSNTVALTFDDGPDPDWTPQILQLLRESNIKATFCLIGQNVEEYPDLVRAIVADGHTLCNHTWDHNEQLGDLSDDAIRSNMQQTSDAIEAAAPGAPISYFRAPGGNWTAPIVEIARELGMTSLDWTVDPTDWTVPPVDSIVNMVTAGCVTGAIFLLHDGGGDRSHTVDAVRQFLPVLSKAHTFIALPTGGA